MNIIYYDCADLNYTSYFLCSFLENEKEFNFNLKVSKKIPNEITEIDGWKDYLDILFSVGLFKLKSGDEEFYFGIDTRDSNSSREEEGKGFHLPLLKNVKYYFKVNYNEDVILEEKELSKFKDKIVPTTAFFPIKPHLPSLYLPDFSSLIQLDKRVLKERYKFFLRNLFLHEIIKFRTLPKKQDIFFVNIYRQNNVHKSDNDFRFEIMNELKKNSSLNSTIGFVGLNIPNEYKGFILKGYQINDYLNHLASSKIAIYVKGLHNCLSFKLGQFLAMGLPIVGQSIINNKDFYKKFNHFENQFAYDDPKEIAYQCFEKLNNEEELELTGNKNSEIFDAYFHPKILGKEILIKIIG